jgi:hypothetical protein
MPDLGTGKSPCSECARLRERYGSASAQLEWAKADVISARVLHGAKAIKAAQSKKEDAVREWEAAKAELEAHVNGHNQKSSS